MPKKSIENKGEGPKKNERGSRKKVTPKKTEIKPPQEKGPENRGRRSRKKVTPQETQPIARILPESTNSLPDPFDCGQSDCG